MMPGAVRRRPTVVVGTLVLVMLAGVSLVNLRLWIIDYGFSSQDRELLRKQFDRANMEAMDESAHWRMKYDGEVERARHYAAELLQGMIDSVNRVEHYFLWDPTMLCLANANLANTKKTLAVLQQENISLQAQVASLNHAVETMKRNCSRVFSSKLS